MKWRLDKIAHWDFIIQVLFVISLIAVGLVLYLREG